MLRPQKDLRHCFPDSLSEKKVSKNLNGITSHTQEGGWEQQCKWQPQRRFWPAIAKPQAASSISWQLCEGGAWSFHHPSVSSQHYLERPSKEWKLTWCHCLKPLTFEVFVMHQSINICIAKCSAKVLSDALYPLESLCWCPNPPVLQKCDLNWRLGLNNQIKMRSQLWALIQWVTSLNKGEIWVHIHRCKQMQGEWPSANQGERRGTDSFPHNPWKELALLTPWIWISSQQNCETVHFYCLSHPVCGTLLPP